MIEKLKVQSCQKLTAKNYLGIYRRFKQFILKLDVRPRAWEDKATLFIGYLTENGMQSSSVKPYLSAIKKTLVVNGYKWNDARVQVATLTRACRLINDIVMTRFCVYCDLLEIMLFQIEMKFNQQPYQEIMYKAMFILGYYGLLRRRVHMARKVLKELIESLPLDSQFYDLHSLRIRRTSNLSKYGYPIEEIKCMRRWKSNAVYKHIRP